ncbi:TnpA family transposase [Janthinobacterium sp. CG_S6]|nr:TnpA family transposase [Janthinobacterium sp. CG_S6]
MPRRSILSATERDSLLALPQSQDDLIQHYSFTESDLSLIRQRRGDANRLGFAVQLCLLRYPGYALAVDMPVPDVIIQWISRQIQSDAEAWPQYGVRDQTRREHFQELRAYLSLSAFSLPDFRKLSYSLADLAMQTDKGLVLAAKALETLRQRNAGYRQAERRIPASVPCAARMGAHQPDRRLRSASEPDDRRGAISAATNA